eukprot:9695873-Alexandrium_andersonii.AAC.1
MSAWSGLPSCRSSRGVGSRVPLVSPLTGCCASALGLTTPPFRCTVLVCLRRSLISDRPLCPRG